MNDKIKEIYMYLLGAFIVAGALGIVFALILYAVPEGNKEVVMAATGSFITLAGMVVGYFYGSSKGSSDKTALLNSKVPNETNK
jgi:hypothetical protein